MKTRYRARIIYAFVISFLIVSTGAWPAETPRHWQTSAFLHSERVDESFSALGVAVDHHRTLYAVGISIAPAAWQIRRSLDGGKSWEKVGALPEDIYNQGSVANSVAVDGRDNVYVVGFASSQVEGHGGYLVRKSSDRGRTWQTVYEKGAADPRLSQDGAFQFKRIAVDGTGAVYILVDFTRVLRSGDGGAHWEEVETFPGVGTSIAATLEGGVAVAGILRNDSNGTDWIVRYSPDGRQGWRTVDRVTGGEALGLCASRPGQELAVVGISVSSNQIHWTARVSSTADPDHWRTVDDFLPSAFGQVFGYTTVNDCAFDNKTDTLYVTGRTMTYDASNNLNVTYQTRAGVVDGTGGDKPFADSDVMSTPIRNTGGLALLTGGQAATVDSHGDVYTVGSVLDPAEQRTNWLVRIFKE